MDRRNAIARVALLMGGTVIGADMFLSSCSSPGKPVAEGGAGAGAPAAKMPDFDVDQIRLLDEVGDTILPTTAASPGAKEAHIGRFMNVMVRDCYTPADQKIFTDGIVKLSEAANKQYNKGFIACDPAERTALLVALDKEQKEYAAAHAEKGAPSHYFRMMKQLTLLGYFTSEVGATKALRYLPVPGRYDGNVPYKKGDKAWATS
ncbi:gluconate 2-dehydrogenase subunit 3 family protein [Hymenobacter coccineus]|uniref:Twin-arginine translocation pathway signal protein n=1 Tax=Hymenobacter coccineus TaxID=1908235 RepID=A0A1G1TK33_9BACT|nr:gluconate 2-dehydrogenase subunit 3 family protein [Hymenobacter coccineus]OGX91251.1 twin-arginine translocation pathway signal protein [Hymenobacter coccineus]